MQFGIHIKVILFGFDAIVKELRQLLFVKAGEERVKVHRLQRLDLHTQKFFVPACVHRHAVVCDDVGFLLGFCEVVGKDARHLGDAFLLGGKNTTVTGNNAIVTVNDNGIDEAELSKRGAELIDLLRAVCSCVVYIRHQLCNGNELHLSRCFHQTSPHSANFSKPPRSEMYFRAISTISSYGLPYTASSPMAQQSVTGLPVSWALRKA